ncbi:hypothetical protein EMST110833_13410 [Empedobacter stercoris]
MKKFIIPTLISLILYALITRPGFFNLIPYSIHQNLFRNSIRENIFIYLFDFLFCIAIWFISYKFINPKR